MLSLKKVLLIAVGMLSVGLGVAGIFLPLLPTTPFLLLSAWCFARSSDRFYDWLMNHRVFRIYIRDYLEERGVPLKTKALALALLWSSIAFSVISVVSLLYVRLMLVLVASVVTLHILKLKTLTRENAGHVSGQRARDRKAIELMLRLYCKNKHQPSNSLCSACRDLLEYAHGRLDHCKYYPRKKACSKCASPCYKPSVRQEMREVMRYAGPRLLYTHPIVALRHLVASKCNLTTGQSLGTICESTDGDRLT